MGKGMTPSQPSVWSSYDSTGDTLRHARRVGALLAEVIAELARRAVTHDESKTQDPELAVFNEFTPKLKHSTYGSEEYKGFLTAMGDALQHHYAHNRHHPEHYATGVDGMNLVDLIEMLADWRAATERHADGNLPRSLDLNRKRFHIGQQLNNILSNTAHDLGWLTPAELDSQ
jgi:Family of unknown function (DUF5662)